jgi:hypothetical protein
MAQRAEYRRALKVGDMTPSFQELDLDKVGAFLKQAGGGPGSLDTDAAASASAADATPPQYAGDVIRQPIMLLYTRMFLVQEFAGVVKEALGAYVFCYPIVLSSFLLYLFVYDDSVSLSRSIIVPICIL